MTAALGSTCAVSRLHKLIPVYSFYSYWRIKEKLYAIASAGTIVNKNSSDESGNLNTATESVCPKGWTLPSAKQISTIGPSGGSSTYVTGFNPVLGGGYVNSTLNGEATRGFWWGSETYGGADRYYLIYNSSVLSSNYNHRNIGLYIRCVSEEKTVADLTYLQDMTGGIANKRCRIFYLS